jgi:hypothetical protein
MVDVGVREHHDVDVPRAKPELSVALGTLGTPALKEAAVEEQAGLLRVHDVA